MASRLLEEFLEIQFFGEFLIDRWVINREQLLEALAYQMERNKRFGAVAVKKDYLTDAQVIQLTDRQQVTDMSLGELAVSVGLLTPEQASEIVKYQEANNVHLGEVLLRLGYITDDLLQRELAHYREHQRRHIPVDVSVPEGIGSRDLLEACVDLTNKMFRRVASTKLKVGHGVVLGPQESNVNSGYYLTAVLPMTGDESAYYVLSVTREVALQITSSILKDDASSENLEMVADAVKEFCNIVCGNAVAKLSRRGFDTEIEPAEAYPQLPTGPKGHTTVAFPVRLIGGGVDLRFFIPSAA